LIANVSKQTSKQRIVASYPVQVKRTVLYPIGQSISVEDGERVVAELLMGEGGVVDVVEEWRKRLQTVRLKENDVWVSVAPLKINPETSLKGFASKLQLMEATIFKSTSILEANISRAANIPIVPVGTDGSLGQLTLRFADRTEAFNKPDPSYILEISVYVLGNYSAEEALVREKQFVTLFVGGFQVDYYKVMPDKSRINEVSLRLQKQDTISYLGKTRGARQFSDAEQYSRLISAFSDELSTNLIPANVTWLEKSKAGSEKKSADDMAKLIRAKFPSFKPV